jgi:phosphoribosylglycinamide formyltransferase-1
VTTPTHPLQIAVLLSGNGTSLESLFERIDTGEIDGQIAVVIASREDAFGLERAKQRGVPAIAVPRKSYPDTQAFNQALHAELAKHSVDLVALLGFMCLFEMRPAYEGRTINVHPALIPAFCGQGYYGNRVHQAVLDKGVRLTGATVHFVDAQYDHGPIILQEAVYVLEDDTVDSLAERVQALERELVARTIQLFSQGRLEIIGQRVRILPAPDSPST